MVNEVPIRVLMLLTDLKVANGVTSFAMNYYRNLDHEKIKMDFVVYYDGESQYYDEIKKNGDDVFGLPSLKNPVKHLLMCGKILKSKKYDVIHNNSLIITYPMMLSAMINHVPVRILHSHNSKLGETRVKEIRNRIFLPLLKATATNYAACSTIAGKAMFGKAKFEFIPNVIVADRYKYDEIRRNEIRKTMSVTDKYVIGTVGRVAYQKNPFFAVDVFEEVLKICPNAEYWWIGSGPLQQELTEYVEKKGLTGQVKLLGSREDVIDLYQAMDCFFLPSLFEGLPVTGIEAQAMGLPCVVSDTVTDEMVYSDLVSFVSLGDNQKKWAEQIVQCGKQNRTCDRLSGSIFSDVGCGNHLVSIYQLMIGES